MAAKIKKGDKVVVLAGRDKGRSGEVVQVMPTEDRAIVRGVNMVKRHTRQTGAQAELRRIAPGGQQRVVDAAQGLVGLQ